MMIPSTRRLPRRHLDVIGDGSFSSRMYPVQYQEQYRRHIIGRTNPRLFSTGHITRNARIFD